MKKFSFFLNLLASFKESFRKISLEGLYKFIRFLDEKLMKECSRVLLTLLHEYMTYVLRILSVIWERLLTQKTKGGNCS